MKRAREELLARPALAAEQDRGVGRGRARERRQRLTNALVLANDAGHATMAGQLFPQELVLGLQTPLLERPRDDEAQVVGVDGLGEKVERALADCTNRVGDAAIRREQDHRHVGIDLTRGPQHTKAVTPRQLEVGQDERRSMTLQELGGIGLVSCLEHTMPSRLQREAEHLTERVTVLDEQDVGRHVPVLPRNRDCG